MAVYSLRDRVLKHRHKIHEMNEFDMETKVKLIFALSAPIDAGFLIEMKRVAEVKVDNQERIIHYKQKDGGLELSAKFLKLSMNQGAKRDSDIVNFLAEKSKTTDKPIANSVLMREFKEKNGYTDSIDSLKHRYQRVKGTIYRIPGIDKNTRIKMMFISNAQLSDDVLKEFRKDADVEVDEEGRITKYKSNDGSLYLEGNHEISSIRKSVYSDRWHNVCRKVDDEIDANWQRNFEQKRIQLVQFLIERTKNAIFPLSIKQLAKDYKTEFKSSDSPDTTVQRIRSFRQRIHETNQFDKPTKVKILFALSASIDAESLNELQKCAIVELDEKQRIKKYKANDGCLELEGDHCMSAKVKAGYAEMKKRRVVIDSSESEEENVGESTRSKQTPTSSSARRSDRLQKSRISLQNKNKKRQLSKENPDVSHTRNHTRMSRAKKRARISPSSSEASEDLEESLTLENGSPESVITQYPASILKKRKRARQVSKDEESLKLEDDSENLNHIPDERKPESLIDTNNADDFDFDPSNYELDMDHLPIDKKPESRMEVNTEESSTTIVGNEYENCFQYDQLNYVDEYIPAEKKPENLLEVKTEIPEEPSGGEKGLIEPKIEECTREVKQEAEEDEEGPSTNSSLNGTRKFQ